MAGAVRLSFVMTKQSPGGGANFPGAMLTTAEKQGDKRVING